MKWINRIAPRKLYHSVSHGIAPQYARRIGGLLGYLVFAFTIGSAQVQNPKIDTRALRIEETGAELSKGALSADSRTFLERDLMSPRPGVSLAAEAKLLWACDLKLYPKPRLQKFIERQTDLADIWWGVLHAGNYGRTLGLTVGGDPTLDQAGLILTTRRKPANTLTVEESAFFSRCLQAKTFGGRFDGLYAIFPKKGLTAADRRWIFARLTAEARKRSVPEREFWQYAVRVVEARNAAPLRLPAHKR